MTANVDKRVNYFDGQFLKAEDFVAEQEYNIDRQRAHQQLFHTSGIAGGLGVTANGGASEALVDAGVAVDGEGRQIVLSSERTVDLRSYADQTVLLLISYDEEQADTAAVGNGNTRWHERPRVEATAEDSAPPSDTHIRLGRIVVSSSGTVNRYDDSVRINAGGRLGDEVEVRKLTISRSRVDPTRWPTLTSGAAGRVDLSGGLSVTGDVGAGRNLTVTGNVGIGTTSPAARLDVAGDIHAGNSDLYFTKTDHNHTGFGNTAGYAAIENAANYDALMILGRAGTAKGRYVRLWDYLQVNGGLDITGNVGIGTDTPAARLDVHGQTILGSDKSTFWHNDPYGDSIGEPTTSIGRLEVGGFDDGSGIVPAILRLHQWGSGAAEFYKPNGTTLILRETPGGGGTWFNKFSIMGADVGIGTTEPEAKLHVAGDFLLQGSRGVLIRSGSFGSSNMSGGNTADQWIKLGEFVLDGNWNTAGADWEIYPGNRNHGNRRQRIAVHARNNNSDVEGVNIQLLNLDSGYAPAIKDVKVVRKSGSETGPNIMAVWVQMGCSWLSGQNSITVHYYGTWNELTLETSPQFDAIQNSGTQYDINTWFGPNRADGGWNFMNGNVGIGTDSPAAQLDVHGQTILGSDKSTFWHHNPYGDSIGEPTTSIGRLEVGGFDDGSGGTVPAILRLHQWGSGAAEFYKPNGQTLILRETPGGNGGWFNRFSIAVSLDVTGAIHAGNSDLYFTKTDHNHTGFGNTTGYAAIENSANYDALMILGRAGTTNGRYVKLWDYLQVNGGFEVTGASTLRQQDWQTPAYQNRWARYANSYNQVGYFKDSMGVVHLRGMVKSGLSRKPIFTLPAGYRPVSRELFKAISNAGHSRVDVLTNGQVMMYDGANGWLSLDGMTFRAK